ncbi:MAG: hypothetical protein KDA84_23785, partial [Planctomycetaceae bacterium]|nr:hypothetical protein [Planctomycetaceae bacterium]
VSDGFGLGDCGLFGSCSLIIHAFQRSAGIQLSTSSGSADENATFDFETAIHSVHEPAGDSSREGLAKQ